MRKLGDRNTFAEKVVTELNAEGFIDIEDMRVNSYSWLTVG